MRPWSIALCMFAIAGWAASALAQDVKINVPWTAITAVDEHEFVKAPGAQGDRQTWTWHPKLQFQLRGNPPSGVTFVAKFTAGGKPWVDVPCRDMNANWECQGVPPEKRSKDTGTFGFELRAKNALDGTDTAVYSGTFKVGKYYDGRAAPAYAKEDKNCFEFYVDHDWTLPLGLVVLGKGQSDYEPMYLQAYMWFKFGYPEPNGTEDVMAYVFHNGQEVCKGHGHDGEEYISESMDTDDGTKKITWSRRVLRLDHCKAKVQNPASFNGIYEMDKNPGEYEIKVLVKGALARVAKFTINPDGTLANPVGDQNPNLNTARAVLPVKVVATQVPYDKDAWKTGLLYGNPLKGFEAP